MKRNSVFLMAALLGAAALLLTFSGFSREKGSFDEEGLLRDIEALETSYLENQALFQEIVAAFEGNDQIENISPSLDNEGKFTLWIGGETVPLSETYPELYASMSTLCSKGFPFISFSRQEEGAVRCYVTVNRYDIAPHGPTGTGIFLYFGENEPEKSSDLDLCRSFSEGCWVLTETNPLE